MAKKIVVVNGGLDEECRKMIRDAAEKAGYPVSFFLTEKEAGGEIGEAEIIYGYTPEAARTSDSLKWLCLPSAGADAFCVPGALKHEDTILTNSSGAYGLTLAEHTIMLTLMLLRRMPEFEKGMAAREWLLPKPQRSIRDSRITLLGAGDIGRCVARRLRPFGPACITAVSRSGVSSEPSFDRVLPQSRLKEILPKTDILIMSLPSTPETAGILNEQTLALLPENAYVVNVGRGDAIDEPALIKALNEGKLAGAALDVMCHEPLPADDPLWEAKNLLMTPHVAGNLTVPYTRHKNAEMFCEDLGNYVQGKPMTYTVNRELRY